MSQFFRFCMVGTIGFVIDAGILQILVINADLSPYLARVVSFLIAVSATWYMNRRYTFAVKQSAAHAEWARYAVFMLLGALVNYGAFALFISLFELGHTQPWIGVAIGAIASLGINFLTSRLLVFRNA